MAPHAHVGCPRFMFVPREHLTMRVFSSRRLILLRPTRHCATPAPQPHTATGIDGVVHTWVGQIVFFFAYSPPSRPLGSSTPTFQPERVTNPTRGCPGALWEASQAVCWLLGREPKPPA